ncbi:hypothetical protein MSG28_002314 [Choristoneura fumiferana]|uniref:Uncharacterized protein n=1 Tax=Choristoneura fumiferana TaxID=7141 RepID=A0ACC0JV21_CHOFU|nr:hypothetical protein MSG28_002314 [Choristoneura fumiferana]
MITFSFASVRILEASILSSLSIKHITPRWRAVRVDNASTCTHMHPSVPATEKPTLVLHSLTSWQKLGTSAADPHCTPLNLWVKNTVLSLLTNFVQIHSSITDQNNLVEVKCMDHVES